MALAITPRTLTQFALRSLGVVRSGQTPSVDTTSDAYTVLNQMIDEWLNEGLMLYADTRTEYALTIGQASYSIGSGGNFNVPRPDQSIKAAGVVISANGTPIETPLRILSTSEYQSISYKSIAGIPSALYDDGAMSQRNLTVYPVPAQACSLALYLPVGLSAFTSLDASYAMPAGYALALWTNLAVLVAPMMELHQKIDGKKFALVQQQAIESKARIKAANTEVGVMSVDAALLSGNRNSGFDWRRG
jgi:hypothetical protein